MWLRKREFNVTLPWVSVPNLTTAYAHHCGRGVMVENDFGVSAAHLPRTKPKACYLSKRLRIALSWIATAAAILLPAEPALAAKDKVDFEVVRYQLPTSKISAKLSLTLEDCTTVPVVSGEAALAADADSASDVFVLKASQFESARIKRTLNVTLHDTGAIATINSATEDRTGSILGNIVKFVANIAGAVFGLHVPGGAEIMTVVPTNSVCSASTLAALQRVHNLEALIGQLRSLPGSSDPKQAAERSKAIDQLAQERAALRTNELHVDLKGGLDLSKLTPGAIDADHPHPNWVVNGDVKTDAITKAWLRDGIDAMPVTAAWRVTPPVGTAPKAAGQQPSDECRHAVTDNTYPAICLVKPVQAAVEVTMASTVMKTRKGAMSIDNDDAFPIPQWGTLQYLPLSTGFGSNREISLTLDKFGRPSEMKWTSQARAETVTAGLAGLAAQANALASANNQVAQQKSEIEQLTTEQQLNKLRACREVLAVGGYTCPE